MSGDSLFAWQALDPDPRVGWYLIAAGILGEGFAPMPLVSSKLDVALQLEGLARMHGESAGQAIRLAEFKKTGGTLKSVTPKSRAER